MAQLKRCVHRAGIGSVSPAYLLFMERRLLNLAQRVLTNASVYKGKRVVITSDDLKAAYGKPTYGCREPRFST